jgi:hypothetical protein
MNTKELSYIFMQIIAILQPKIEGKGKNKTVSVDPGNIDLLKSFIWDLNDTFVNCYSQDKINEYREWNVEKNDYDYRTEVETSHFIEILGEGYNYKFTPDTAPDVCNKIKKLLPKNDIEIIHNQQESFTLSFIMWKEQIKQFNSIAKFVSSEDLRPVMQCVYIGKGEICGTDAHGLKWQKTDLPADKEILINKEGQKFIRSCKDYVNVYESGTQIKLENGQKVLIIEKVQGNYPDFHNVIPENEYYFKVDCEKLLTAVKSISVYSNQASNLLILDYRGKYLQIGSQDIDFCTEAFSNLNIIDSNCHFRVGLKSIYLIQILRDNKNKEVTIKLNNTPGQALIFDDDYLLMPMLIGGEDPGWIEPNSQLSEFEQYLKMAD